MKLDAPLSNFILTTWADEAHQNQVRAVLAPLPQHKPGGLIAAKTITGKGCISPEILVITADKIGYGWPMVQVLWRKRG